MTILKDLLAIDNTLFGWIVRNQAQPGTTEWDDMRRVDAARTRVSQMYNVLVLEDLTRAIAGLDEKAKALNDLTAEIKETATTIEKAKELIAIAAKVVEIAAQVVALLAAA